MALIGAESQVGGRSATVPQAETERGAQRIVEEDGVEELGGRRLNEDRKWRQRKLVCGQERGGWNGEWTSVFKVQGK